MSNIKRIVLEVGGVELSLSPEDAKTLQAALNELFPTRKEIQYVPYLQPVHPRPYWYTYASGVRLMSANPAGAIGTATTSGGLNLSGSSFQVKGNSDSQTASRTDFESFMEKLRG